METGQPLVGAQISIEGTNLGGLSNESGRFSITNVPAGTRTLRAEFLGYTTATRTVEVVGGQTMNVTLALEEEAIGLEGIVVTAAGEEVRRRELGNVVGNIRPDEGDLAAMSTFSDLIQGRSAGVTVSAAGGTVGTGSRIRVRGASSVSLSNDPLIVIDGVRADNTSESSTIDVGGQSFSRFEDINPDDVDNVEVLKGPAATTRPRSASGTASGTSSTTCSAGGFRTSRARPGSRIARTARRRPPREPWSERATRASCGTRPGPRSTSRSHSTASSSTIRATIPRRSPAAWRRG